MKEAFSEINEEIMKKNEFNDAGSVALCGIIRDKVLYIGHLGDSKALIV